MQITNAILRHLQSLSEPLPHFHTDDLPENPTSLFLEWLNSAIKADVREPHAMTLSTVDDNGAPDARILILKNINNNKWYFATSVTSKKGQQISDQPKVALTFYWAELGRQVRIRGDAVDMGKEESTKDFLARSKEARAMALIGNQSEELKTLEDLNKALQEKKELLNQKPDTTNPNWTLYAVNAEEVEFWQGDSERKHTRVDYQRNGEKWEHRLLWP